MTQERSHRGLLLVLSGPSGAGKTELVKRMRALEPGAHYCVTATTRPARTGERHGIDYFFYSDDAFHRLQDEGEFLEFARVPPDIGYMYGTPRQQILEALQRGEDVVVQVDVQGARSIRARVPSAILIFLKTPGFDTLRQRLLGRATEATPEMEQRLGNARAELEREREFDYTVVNPDGGLNEAVAGVLTIMHDERSRVHPRYASLLP